MDCCVCVWTVDEVRGARSHGKHPVVADWFALKPRAHSLLFSRSRTLWTVITAAGVKSTVLSDKRGIIQVCVWRESVVFVWGEEHLFFARPPPTTHSQRFRLGVPIRDMRLMDAAIFAPDAAVILVRDNAIVLRMEHVRLIVTADEVLLPQDGALGDAAGARFGAALLDAILDAVAEVRARVGGSDSGDRPLPPVLAAHPSHEPDPLPFELTVLEAALREVSTSATTAVKELESVATPALDALTRTVTTPNLERVRKIKTRHQRVLGRVQSLREELQGFLDDDADMFRMCLTRRADAERAIAAASGDRTSTDRGARHPVRLLIWAPPVSDIRRHPCRTTGHPHPRRGRRQRDCGRRRRRCRGPGNRGKSAGILLHAGRRRLRQARVHG